MNNLTHLDGCVFVFNGILYLHCSMKKTFNLQFISDVYNIGDVIHTSESNMQVVRTYRNNLYRAWLKFWGYKVPSIKTIKVKLIW